MSDPRKEPHTAAEAEMLEETAETDAPVKDEHNDAEADEDRNP